ncbi:MAG: HTH domain-containing protein [Clostridia bacterium]
MKNRQLDILIYLLKNKKTTYTELANYFEVSTKTIERDINRLSSASIPVYCKQGSGGGVYIDETYKFSTSFFTPEEIYHMVTSLHIAKSFTNNPLNQDILQKLCLIAPNITTIFEENVSEYLNIDLFDKPVDFESGIFLLINKCLDFKLYANIDNQENLACLGYVYKVDGIYLFAHGKEYQLIKISEIQSFECTDITYSEQFLSYNNYKKSSLVKDNQT